MRDRKILILRYSNNAVLLANLQRLLHLINCKAKSLNIVTAASKTNYITTSNIPLRWKLGVYAKIIQREIKFKFPGIESAPMVALRQKKKIKRLKQRE